ncbi:MAG TPA: LptE family protein [Candidatus Saccharicenans sp.]|nr:LptE family protein [Candidatus Saccharicenans sp.]HOL45981.1 LptE family protein [Candidatus Saccharicenans sp.]
MRFFKKYIASCLCTVLAIISLAGCGYQLRGRGSVWPPDMKRLCVPVFKNTSGRFELDVKLTRSVINELITRARVSIEPDQNKAQGLLVGEITSFKVQPIAFSSEGAASRYKITVVTSVVFTDLLTDQILFADDNFTYVDEYEVSAGLDYETMENQAIDRLVEKYARQLVVSLLEGF